MSSAPPPSRSLAWLLALLVALLATLAVVSISLLSAARAYVAGESQWSRYQKTATLHLLRYAEYRLPGDWAAYRAAIEVPLGDRRAREELDKPTPDLAVVRAGFLAGQNHADDIDGLVRLYRWFHHVPQIERAIAVWTAGDAEVAALVEAADAMHRAVQGGADAAALAPWREQIHRIEARVTPLETEFSARLGEAARLMHDLLVGTVLVGAALFAALAVTLTRRTQHREVRQTEALRESETLFRSLWQTTNDAVLIVDPEHQIRFANPAAHHLFGHAPGSLVGQPLARLQPERLHAGHRAGTERYLRSGQRRLDWRGTEIMALHADGHEFPMEIRFGEFELGGERRFVGFLRDITDRKQAEREILEANTRLEQRVAERTQALSSANQRLLELDRMKSQFLATMSHELRTPLNSILGFAAVLLRGLPGPLNAEQQRQLGFVHASGKHLLALINDLLDLSRIESGRMEVAREAFDFADVATEAAAQLRPLADAKHLAMHVDVAPGLAMRGDRRKVYQVLLNLLGNAIKFTPSGSVSIGARAEGGELRLQVIDTGIGIAPEHLGRLFDAFQQIDNALDRTHEGTGLGLYLSRKLVELMGGRIEVASERGRGSCFGVVLPLALPALAEEQVPV